MQYTPLYGNIPAVKWSHEHEKKAQDDYTKIMSETHHDFLVELSDLVINTKYLYMTANPDGKCIFCAVALI